MLNANESVEKNVDMVSFDDAVDVKIIGTLKEASELQENQKLQMQNFTNNQPSKTSLNENVEVRGDQIKSGFDMAYIDNESKIENEIEGNTFYFSRHTYLCVHYVRRFKSIWYCLFLYDYFSSFCKYKVHFATLRN